MSAKSPIPVAELREAALLAEGLLPVVARRLKQRARGHGVEYGEDDIDAAVAALIAELGRPPPRLVRDAHPDRRAL